MHGKHASLRAFEPNIYQTTLGLSYNLMFLSAWITGVQVARALHDTKAEIQTHLFTESAKETAVFVNRCQQGSV